MVKGVKNMQMRPGGSTDKEEPGEIVVSAAEPGSPSVNSGSPGEPCSSAALSQKEDINESNHSSHFGKKEYREIGVGSADENHDVHATQGR